MDERAVVFIVIGVAVAVAAVVLALLSRSAKAVREMLRGVAAAAGWTGITNLKLRTGLRGTWRSFAVSFSYAARQKSTPQRLMLDVGARSDVRLIVSRRFSGMFSGKPLAWFGPPRVDVHAPAAAQFWIRTDEVNLAERLFSDPAVAAAIDGTIVARYDSLRVGNKGLRIIRALDEAAVRAKYGFPKFTMRMEPGRFEPLAREEWRAAEAVVNKLGLM